MESNLKRLNSKLNAVSTHLDSLREYVLELHTEIEKITKALEEHGIKLEEVQK